ncbi:transmembrane protein 144b isoform X2 [Triplophysa rosa]|uniref:transmembrane protein 144b isoform X2 n=1 Tax=Triplophysa rosa TaxID=992332 RepID=UPI002545BF1B|nr:transmembrane protein 144b isoform X2 [Triplophysa rosa]
MAFVAEIVLFVVTCFSTLSAEESPCTSSSTAKVFSSNEANSTDTTYGFVACVFAILLYGSNFVPVKTIDTGDGMFFQWVSCSAIWFVGLVVDILFHPSRSHPAAMLGGAIWATGNLAAVPVVKFIGLGLGILLWGSSGLLIGWASSRFGWFGLHPEDVSKPILNYCGAGLCLLSAIIFFFVKSDVQKRSSAEAMPLLIDDRRLNPDNTSSRDSWVDTISPRSKRVFGCILAIFAGVLYGCSFVPVFYIKVHATTNSSMFIGSSQNETDYCFAHYSGIFLMSTVYFLAYCAAMKNRPRIYPRAILPSFLSGLMWGIATYAWLMANYYLSAVITFPIINAGYGLVAALWGSVVFKEVKGLGNLLMFVLATCVVVAGSILTAYSKL